MPILSGGTGLYIDSVIYDMDFSNKPEGGIFNKRRDELYRIAEEEGNEALHAKLAELSSKRAGEIHPNNIKKVVRAIEILESGENPGDEVLRFALLLLAWLNQCPYACIFAWNHNLRFLHLTALQVE